MAFEPGESGRRGSTAFWPDRSATAYAFEVATSLSKALWIGRVIGEDRCAHPEPIVDFIVRLRICEGEQANEAHVDAFEEFDSHCSATEEYPCCHEGGFESFEEHHGHHENGREHGQVCGEAEEVGV